MSHGLKRGTGRIVANCEFEVVPELQVFLAQPDGGLMAVQRRKRPSCRLESYPNVSGGLRVAFELEVKGKTDVA